MKKVFAVVLLCLAVSMSAPLTEISQARGYGGHQGGYAGGGHYGGHRGGGYYGGGHRGYYGGGYYGGHGGHHNDDWAWGAAGFLLGTAFGAAVYSPPVYSYGPPPPVYYSYQPPMCRYDRYVTDQWGRSYVESYVAPCR